MTRKRIEIPKHKLVKAVRACESNAKSLHELHTRVVAYLNDEYGIGAIRERIKEYEITTSVQPGKRHGGRTTRAKGQEVDLTPFTSRGLTVRTLGDMVASHVRDEKTNKLIKDAWREVRKQHDLPCHSYYEKEER